MVKNLQLIEPSINLIPIFLLKRICIHSSIYSTATPVTENPSHKRLFDFLSTLQFPPYENGACKLAKLTKQAKKKNFFSLEATIKAAATNS